jgi:hypothetical protein
VASNPTEAKQLFSRHFRETIRTLTKLGVEVYIVNQVPSFRFNVSRRLVKVLWLNRDPESTLTRPLSEHQERMSFLNGLFAEVSGPHVHILDPAPFLCREGVCYGTEGNAPLYRDSNHLTYLGSQKLKPLLEQILQNP